MLKIQLLTKRTIIIFTLCLFAFPLNAQDYKILPPASQLHCLVADTNPNMPKAFEIFNHVQKVNIILDINSYEGFNSNVEMPTALERKYLKSMLKALYQQRYKILFDMKGNVIKARNDPGCYGRNNQPVFILPFRTNEEKKEAQAQSLSKGTLTVYVSLLIESKEQAIIKIAHYRPHLQQTWWRRFLRMPANFWEVESKNYTFNYKQTEHQGARQNLRYKIESFLVNRIN